MSRLHAPGFPEDDVRRRAGHGTPALFPQRHLYGSAVFGASAPADGFDIVKLVPPVFVPGRLEKLIELNREPLYSDVDLATTIGGFAAPLPVYISALGSTQIASSDISLAICRQAGGLGIPLVIGENVAPVGGFGRGAAAPDTDTSAVGRTMLERIRAYVEELPDGTGGIVVQQSTEDADAEVWNLVYTDPTVLPLLETGRLAIELKVGQGAKPGVGGMTLVGSGRAAALARQYHLDAKADESTRVVLRHSSPGTFTEEILRQQVHLMCNNYPRCRIWVKLPPARDVALAASVAWDAGADAVCVDGGEGGTGWAPLAFLDHVGLPLLECLRRIGRPRGSLLVSGRMFDGARAVKSFALGATAVGLARAAVLAVDENPQSGLRNLVSALGVETQLLISALGRYTAAALTPEDLWFPDLAPMEAP